MEDVEDHCSDNNHPKPPFISIPLRQFNVHTWDYSQSLQDKEQPLILHQRTGPALSHLNNPVHTSDQDGDGGNGESTQKQLELQAPPQLGVDWIPGGHRRTDNPQSIVGADNHEHGKREDLEPETGQHDVCSHLRGSVVLRVDRSDTTTRTLKKEGEEVAGDEYVSVRLWLNAGDGGAKDDDDAGKAQVDTGGEEGGGEGKTDDLDEEVVLVVDVPMGGYTAYVADDFNCGLLATDSR